jgi:hypothetical protein
VGYAPGPPFAEREVPIPEGTVLIDDDGAGATVALPVLPVAAIVEVLRRWAGSVLGGASIGGVWWATTFEDDEPDDEHGDQPGHQPDDGGRDGSAGPPRG